MIRVLKDFLSSSPCWQEFLDKKSVQNKWAKGGGGGGVVMYYYK